jgi:hypothetical protein
MALLAGLRPHSPRGAPPTKTVRYVPVAFVGGPPSGRRFYFQREESGTPETKKPAVAGFFFKGRPIT